MAMADYGYDVISIDTATTSGSVVDELGFINDIFGVSANHDTGALDLRLNSKLLTYLCSNFHQSAIESLTGNTNSSFTNPFHVMDHADRKQQTSDYFRFVVDVYVVASICIIGFIGNALTVAVLRLDPDKTNSTTWLLQALAAVDTLYLAACLVIQPLKAVHEATEGGLLPPAVFPSVERHVWPLAAATQTATVWIVLLVTADRYVAVCRPFQAKWRNINRTRALVVGVCLLSVLYNLPQWFEREVVSEIITCSRQHVTKLKKTPLVDNLAYFIIYKTVCHFVFRTVGPLLALSLLNWRLVQSLRAVRRRRQRNAVSSTVTSVKLRGGGKAPLSSNVASTATGAAGSAGAGAGGRGRENVTMMVVAVICVFIVCELPDVALRVIGTVANDLAAAGDTQEMSDYTAGDDIGFFVSPAAIQALNSVTNALLALNSAANFAVYCLVGKKFRRILRRRIFRCFSRTTKSPGDARSNYGGCFGCCRPWRDSVENAAGAGHSCTRLDGYSMAATRVPAVPVASDTVNELERRAPIRLTDIACRDANDLLEPAPDDNIDSKVLISNDDGDVITSHRQHDGSFSRESAERCIVAVIETEVQWLRTPIGNNVSATGNDVDARTPSSGEIDLGGGGDGSLGVKTDEERNEVADVNQRGLVSQYM